MVKNLTRYNGNFVACAKQIAEAGQRMATAREGMLDRIADVKENRTGSDYFNQGGWHSEGIARISGVNHWCLAKYAPTTNYAQETLNANLRGNYLSLTDEIKLGKKPASEVIKQVAEQDASRLAEQRRVLIPERQETFTIDSQHLGDLDIARFLARSPKLAQEYGMFLKDSCGIPSVTFYQPSGSQDFASGLWLHGLGRDNASYFSGSYRYFCSGDGSSFGVCSRASTEQSLEYSPKIIGKVIMLELASRGLQIKGFKEKVLERLARQ